MIVAYLPAGVGVVFDKMQACVRGRDCVCLVSDVVVNERVSE